MTSWTSLPIEEAFIMLRALGRVALTPPACCANPPAPRAPLQSIEEAVSDAEDSNVVVERLEDRIGEKNTLSFLTGSNQG